MAHVQDRSGPGSLGFRVTELGEASDSEFIFIGGRVLMSNARAEGGWHPPTGVVRPERFGDVPAGDGIVTAKERKMGRAWVEKFVAEWEQGMAEEAARQASNSEAISTNKSASSMSWHGAHWFIMQEQVEGLCMWEVQTGGRPLRGGNYDVGLADAVAQVRAALDERGLAGDPEQVLS